MNGRQGDFDQRSVFRVVKAHDPDVVRHANVHLLQTAQEFRSGQIVRADKRIPTPRRAQQPNEFRIVRVSALHPVGSRLEAAGDAQVILLGGMLSREASSTVGPLTEQTLAELSVGKVFLGTQALDLADGLTDTTLEIAQTKRAMIKAARQVILLADSAKWDHTGFIKVAPLAEVDVLISDQKFPAKARAAVEQLGVRLVLV